MTLKQMPFSSSEVTITHPLWLAFPTNNDTEEARNLRKRLFLVLQPEVKGDDALRTAIAHNFLEPVCAYVDRQNTANWPMLGVLAKSLPVDPFTVGEPGSFHYAIAAAAVVISRARTEVQRRLAAEH
jgi:hypothetical protein